MARLLIDAGANIRATSHLGYTPIRNAVYSGNIELVRLFLDYDADASCEIDIYGASLLHVACLQGNHEMTRLLLEMGTAVDQSEHLGGRTPLHIACSVGSRPIVSTLLESSLCNVNAKTRPEGWTPLYWSVCVGHLEIINLLLNSGKVDVNAKSDDEGLTPLYYCVSNNTRLDILEKLIEFGADVDSKNGNKEWTCLQNASFLGKKSIVCCLCDHRASMDVTDANGQNALTLACEKNHLDVVDLLLSRGADANTIHPSTTCTLLWDAITSENYNLATILLKHKAEIHCAKKTGNQRGDDDDDDDDTMTGLSLMHYASYKQNLQIMEFLLSNGYDLGRRFEKGNSLLHIMSAAGYVEGINVLIAAGMTIQLENDMKETPLHIACQYDKADAAKALLLIDATGYNHFNKLGHTPLHVAILSSTSLDLMISFHEHGANYNELTADGSTAFHLLCENIQLSKILLSSDCNDGAIILKKLMFPNPSSKLHAFYRNKLGRSPLHAACTAGNLEIISKYFSHIRMHGSNN